MTALIAHKVMAADIMNAYLTAPNKGKMWILLGPEFWNYKGHKAIVARSLNGLKSAGAEFRNHLADCIRQLGMNPIRLTRTYG